MFTPVASAKPNGSPLIIGLRPKYQRILSPRCSSVKRGSLGFARISKAWRFFQELAPTYRRHFVGWIHLAKRPETRNKRTRELIALLAAGKKMGLK